VAAPACSSSGGGYERIFAGFCTSAPPGATRTWRYHGTALYGATNSRIVNNTVIYRHEGDKGVPWIKIEDHKNGTPSTGNLVRNNLVTALAITSKGVTEDHTILLSNPAQFFVNQAGFDLHLLPGAPAIDQGSSDQAPAIDADGVPRPQGAAVDVGAYEWHAGASAGSGGSGNAGSGQAGSGQAGSGQAGSGNAGSGQSGNGQAGGGQAGSGNAGSGQAGSGQAGGAAGGSSSGGASAGGAAGKSGTGGSAAGGKGGGVAGAAGSSGGTGKPAGSGGAAGKGGAGASAGATGGEAASPTGAADDGGCGCHLPGKSAPRGAASLVALLLLLRRRRRGGPAGIAPA
jgi:MYXO-CTERM domain-containing protein